MTIKDLLAIITYNEDATIFFEIIAKDGRGYEIEQINGSYYDNLDDGTYWVDTNYDTEETEDEVILSAYDILLTPEELGDLEVIKFDIGTYCHTIRAKMV